MTATASEPGDPVLALASVPNAWGNSFLGLSSVASPAVPMNTFGSLGTRDGNSIGARWGTWLKFKCMSICQSLHESGPAWGGKPRGPFRGSVSQTQENAAQALPESPAMSKKKAGGLGCRRNLLDRSRWWAAGLTGPGPGLYLWRSFGCFHQRCGWLTLDGVPRHSQGGSFPMQIHRLLTNLPPRIQKPPGANASPSAGGSQ